MYMHIPEPRDRPQPVAGQNRLSGCRAWPDIGNLAVTNTNVTIHQDLAGYDIHHRHVLNRQVKPGGLGTAGQEQGCAEKQRRFHKDELQSQTK